MQNISRLPIAPDFSCANWPPAKRIRSIFPAWCGRARRAWFPDGSHLLVNAAQATGVMSVYNVPLLGGSARKIVENADARSISPDGSQIAVVRNDWPQQEVWIFSSDGQNSRQLIAAIGRHFRRDCLVAARAQTCVHSL